MIPNISPKRFDLIVFDWDGTLSDSTGLIARAIQSASRDLGQPVPSDHAARYVIGMGLRDALTYAVPSLPAERYSELQERYRVYYLAHQRDIVLFDGAIALLQNLKQQGHRLAVATGKSRRGLDEALATPELQGLFDASRTPDETASKPHPQMLLELMAQLGSPPERTLMIGDTTHDLQMALNAQVPSVAVSYGAHEPHTFAQFPTRFVAHSVAELQAWLGGCD
jgi:phosphoglycolate phosphatase